jgi:hypothetical protein
VKSLRMSFATQLVISTSAGIAALAGPQALAQRVAAAGGAAGPLAAEAFGLTDALPPALEKPALRPPSEQFGLIPDGGATLLPDLPAEAWDQINAEDAEQALIDKTVRYGLWRGVGIAPGAAGEWNDIIGQGSLWIADVTVSGAIGVRLNFADMDLPPGGQVFVYSPTYPERVWGPFENRGVADGDFWTPTTFGETARIEYFLPFAEGHDVQTATRAVGDDGAPMTPFRIPACQHVYLDPVADYHQRVGACHNDANCYAAWANEVRAAAGIGTINSNALFCSGTMLTASNNDQTPYWLTANHCIGSASAATNSEIFWLYQTSACGGSVPALSSVPQSFICTRLSNSSTSDHSLLMVEGTIPSGLSWAGWTSAAVANGTNVTCIHHPDGSWKRISFATKTSGAAANFIRADWYDAPTEPGSSGSGLFRDDTRQLVGQLYGGPSSCASESYDDYGAFATTYSAISGLLAGGSDDAYDDNDSCATARAMSAGTYSGLVVKRYTGGDEDWYSFNLAAGATLTVTLNFTHANGDVDMQLYDTCGGAVLKSSTGTGNSETFAQTNSGGSAVNYLLRVYLASDTRNTYSMTLSTGGGGGSNDTCANAVAVVNGGTYSGSTASATIDGSASCGSSSATRDVWYKYTAPAAGTLRVDSCGSSYDTVVSLHSACVGTSANQLTCNDDCGGAPCGGLNSCISRAVTGGATYYIRVSGYNGANGSFTLHVTGP